ncbi:hypothetical protein PAMP_020285 [Pampus punctatissimus]
MAECFPSISGCVEEVRPVWLQAVGGAQLQSDGSSSVSQSVWRRPDLYYTERPPQTTTDTTERSGQHGAVRAAAHRDLLPKNH